jgi:hypothetical protein
MDDRELCNNATPSRCAKSKTCSGSPVVMPRDSGIIMQQSPLDCGILLLGILVLEIGSQLFSIRSAFFGCGALTVREV